MNSIFFFPFITLVEREDRFKVKQLKEKNIKYEDNIYKDNMNKINDISPSSIAKDEHLLNKDKYQNLVCLSNLEEIVVLPEKDNTQLIKPKCSINKSASLDSFFNKYHDFFEP